MMWLAWWKHDMATKPIGDRRNSNSLYSTLGLRWTCSRVLIMMLTSATELFNLWKLPVKGHDDSLDPLITTRQGQMLVRGDRGRSNSGQLTSWGRQAVPHTTSSWRRLPSSSLSLNLGDERRFQGACRESTVLRFLQNTAYLPFTCRNGSLLFLQEIRKFTTTLADDYVNHW